MNRATDPVLETLSEHGPLPVGGIELNLERRPGAAPSRRTIHRALNALLEYGFIVKTPERDYYYENTPRGERYLAGEYDASRAESHGLTYYRGVTPEGGSPVMTTVSTPDSEAEVATRSVAATDNGEGASPGSFYEWGRDSDGARRLATDLLEDATGDATVARKYTAEFVDQVIVELDDGWTLSDEAVRQFVRSRDPGALDPSPPDPLD